MKTFATVVGLFCIVIATHALNEKRKSTDDAAILQARRDIEAIFDKWQDLSSLRALLDTSSPGLDGDTPKDALKDSAERLKALQDRIRQLNLSDATHYSRNGYYDRIERIFDTLLINVLTEADRTREQITENTVRCAESIARLSKDGQRTRDRVRDLDGQVNSTLVAIASDEANLKLLDARIATATIEQQRLMVQVDSSSVDIKDLDVRVQSFEVELRAFLTMLDQLRPKVEALVKKNTKKSAMELEAHFKEVAEKAHDDKARAMISLGVSMLQDGGASEDILALLDELRAAVIADLNSKLRDVGVEKNNTVAVVKTTTKALDAVNLELSQLSEQRLALVRKIDLLVEKVKLLRKEMAALRHTFVDMKFSKHNISSSCNKTESLFNAHYSVLEQQLLLLAEVKVHYLLLPLEIRTTINVKSAKTDSKYGFRVYPWSACSATCGRGVQTRKVSCISFDEGEVSTHLCPSLNAPADTQPCELKPCKPTCVFTPYVYGACSSTCGAGIQAGSRRMVYGDEECLKTTSLVRTKPCLYRTCGGDRNHELSLWLDASDASRLDVKEGRVSRWRDSSKNHAQAVQAEGELQPYYELVDSKNELHAVVFRGNPYGRPMYDGKAAECNRLDVSAVQVASVYAPSRSITVFTVLRIDNPPAGASGFEGFFMTFAKKKLGWGDFSTSQFDSGMATHQGGTPLSLPQGQLVLISTTLDVRRAAMEVRVNGAVVAKESTNGGDIPDYAGLVLGARGDKCLNSFSGAISELMVFEGAMSDVDRQVVEDSLSKKWKLK